MSSGSDLLVKKHVDIIMAISEKPELSEFSDFYSEEEIAKDIEEIAKIKKDYADKIQNEAPEKRQIIENELLKAKAVEVIFTEGVRSQGWFENPLYSFEAEESSEYDDIINKIDVNLGINSKKEENEQHTVALAIDASTNPNLQNLQKKVIGEIQKVLEGRAKNKYARIGREGLVLPVIIGINGHNTDSLISLFSSIISIESKPQIKITSEEKEVLERKKMLAKKHPSQIIFLKEIKSQLKMYARLLRDKNSHTNKEYKKEIEALLIGIDEILDFKKQKEDSDNEQKSLEDDDIYNLIKYITSEITETGKIPEISF